jgi:polysaccharide export outer membrane protein
MGRKAPFAAPVDVVLHALLVLFVCSLCSVALAQSSNSAGPARLELQLSRGIGSGGSAATAASAGSSTAPSNTPSRGSSSNDPIEAGDSVTVTVYREPDMSVQAQKVRPDGTISLPLLGEVRVDGMTSKELQARITRLLADGYLKQPNVTVNVEQYRLYFIKGEVQKPGGYNFVSGLTVEKAIVLAGGYTERASRNNITVVRERTPDSPIKGAALSSSVLPGDVITVEESFF